MLLDILIISAPGIVLALGALAAEYAGVMTIFLEGCINLGAFFCFAIAVWSGNIYFAIICSCVVCMLFVFVVWIFVKKTGANIFLVGAGINLFAAGIIPLFSQLWFGTSGVVAANIIEPSAFFVRNGSTLMSFLLVACFVFIVLQTSWGISLRVCGNQKDVLAANTINTAKLQCQSWIIASAFASFAGAVLTIRLQSFVPNISSGKGWIALAAVFLGRKNVFGVIAASLLFAAAEYAANRMQGFYSLQPSFMLTIPYFITLILFIIVPSKKQKE